MKKLFLVLLSGFCVLLFSYTAMAQSTSIYGYAVEWDGDFDNYNTNDIDAAVMLILDACKQWNPELLNDAYAGKDNEAWKKQLDGLFVSNEAILHRSIPGFMVVANKDGLAIKFDLQMQFAAREMKKFSGEFKLSLIDGKVKIISLQLTPDLADSIPKSEEYLGKSIWNKMPKNKGMAEKVERVTKNFVMAIYATDRGLLQRDLRVSASEEQRIADDMLNLPQNIKNIKLDSIEYTALNENKFQVKLNRLVEVNGKEKPVLMRVILDISNDGGEPYITNVILDPPFSAVTSQIVKDFGNVKVICEVSPELKEYVPKLMEKAREAYEFYTKLYGEAPYDTIKIQESVHMLQFKKEQAAGQTDSWYIGLPADTIKNMDDMQNNATLAHEISHFWWGGGQESNQIFFVEGLARFSEMLFLRDKCNGTIPFYLNEYRNLNIIYANPVANFITKDVKLADLTYDSYPQGAWDNLAFILGYGKEAYVLEMLRKEIGDDLFFKTLRKFYDENQIATLENFEDMIKKVTQKDYSWFFDQWIYNTGYPSLTFKYEVVKDSKEDILKVALAQKDYTYRLNLPLTVQVNGAKETVMLNLKENKQTWELKFPGKIEKVYLDPDYDCLKFVEGSLADNFAKALQAKNEKKFSVAEKIYKDALSDEYEGEYAKFMLLDTHKLQYDNAYERKEFFEAEQYAKEILSIAPEIRNVKLFLADANLKQGKLDDAFRISQEAVEDQPDDSITHSYLAGIAFRIGDFRLAKAEYEEVLKLKPESQIENFVLGNIAYLSGDKLKALDYFSNTLIEDNKAFNSRLRRIEIYLEFKRIDEALEDCKYLQSVQEELDCGQAAKVNLLLGELYDLQGKRKEALECYKEVLKSKADPIDAQDATKLLEMPFELPLK